MKNTLLYLCLFFCLVGIHDNCPGQTATSQVKKAITAGDIIRTTYSDTAKINLYQGNGRFGSSYGSLAVELIKQTALFYRNISRKGADGLWHLFVNPSMGQDEKGGFNQEDYLDALYSAKYCFQKAIEYKLDSANAYKSILTDGLAFPTLMSSEGFYHANKGVINERTGGQKHPVQLNALAFLPVNEHATTPDSIAYQKRYSITLDANKPYFFGWTLGEFLLAGSRMGDVSGWKKDWNNLAKSDYVDSEWIQVYETSRAHTESFYSITNGLVIQSLLSNLVDDWFNKLEIAKCNPWKGPIYFKNIHSVLGVKLAGEINGQTANLQLIAWKDCQFTLRDKRILMKKGDVMKVKIGQGKASVVKRS